jgi:hypothetical protein
LTNEFTEKNNKSSGINDRNDIYTSKLSQIVSERKQEEVEKINNNNNNIQGI